MALIDEIRAKFSSSLFEFSRHGLDQTILRDISVAEVRQSIAAGEVIEDYADDKFSPSCLILGRTESPASCAVQLSVATDRQSY
jgi:Domain of unknown function (DUF4258)